MKTQGFWVSNYNYIPDVRNEYRKLNKKIKIYDTTLRDGEQSVGVSLDAREKLIIAQKLAESGVDRIEAGFPSSSDEDKIAVSNIVSQVKGAEIWGFGRCNIDDIKLNIETGIRNMVCEILTSPEKMKAWNLSEETIIKRISEAISYAKKENIYTAFFAVDATRANPSFLKRVYQLAVNDCEADEVVIVDTLGVATPEAMAYLTRLVKSWVNVPVAVHCHNDFGLALACTLASLKEGADSVHVTVNGLGEKAGNTDISELAIVLHGLYGVETNLKLKKLYELSKLVEELTGISVSPLKPVVGEKVFTRESGLVVTQMLSYPPSVEGYNPEVIGRKREVALGKKSGRKSIEYALDELKIKLPEEQVGLILKKVKDYSIKNKTSVSLDKFKSIVMDNILTKKD